MPKLNIEKFKELRSAKNWTLADIARRAKVGFGTPSRWEHGLTNPTSRLMERLAEIFEVEVEELIDKDEER
jgi:transcriptional regulator with XRE-family HTH domain